MSAILRLHPASVRSAHDPSPVLDARLRTVLARVVERLALTTPDAIPVADLTALVVRCHADLEGSPGPALPALVEQLARERLGEVAAVSRRS